MKKSGKSFFCAKVFLFAAAAVQILLSVIIYAFAEETQPVPSPKDFCYYDNLPFAEFADIEVSNIEAYAAVAVNLETGSVMYEKNPLQKVYPASTVKIMTAIVALENIPDIDVMIYASESAVKASSGTRINPTNPIKAGEGFTARELLYALLVTGANDAANVLAEYVSGTIEDFCVLMNEKAKEIGAKYTNFTNPTGLHDPEMVTTAYDMALIANYAYYINDLVKIAGSTNYTIEATNLSSERRYLYNRNRMIRRVESETDYFYSGTLGLSAGSTPEGGNCVIAVAERDGLTYLTVVMNSSSTETENFAYRDSITLLDMCFDNFAMQKVAAKGEMMCEIPVALAESSDHITLHAAEDITALLPVNINKDEDIILKRLVYEDAKAPVSEGQIFGELVAAYKGTITLGSTALVSNSTIDRSTLLYILDVLRRFFTGRWFITALITAAVLFAIYCFLYYKAYKRKNKNRNRNRNIYRR